MWTLKAIYSRWWVQCILLWLAVFIFLNVAGLIGSRILELGEGAVGTDLTSLCFVPGIWMRWDSNHYLGVARDGYINHPGAAGFFPLYPLLIYFLHKVARVDITVGALVVSNLSFLFACLILYKIARIIKDEHLFALRSVLAMLVFPTSFFYFAIYAESLYLAFALLGVYLVIKDPERFIVGGLALGLASIARPVGWLVDIVMVVVFFQKRNFNLKNWFSLGIGGLLSISGILLYIYYLYLVLGSFMAIPNAQAAWPRHWDFPWDTYYEGLKILASPSLIRENWFAYAMNAMDFLFTSFAVVVIVISFLRAKQGNYPWSLFIYSIFALLFFLSSQNELPSPLWGMSRWVGSLFSLFFVLGNMLKNKKMQTLYFMGSSLLLVFFTVWWTSGRWIG